MGDVNLEKLTRLAEERAKFLEERQLGSLAEKLAYMGKQLERESAEGNKTLIEIADRLIFHSFIDSENEKLNKKLRDVDGAIANNEFLYLIMRHFGEDLVPADFPEGRKSALLSDYPAKLILLYEKRVKYNGFNPFRRIKSRQFNKNIDNVCSQFYSELKENIKSGKITAEHVMITDEQVLSRLMRDKEFAEFCYSELRKSFASGEIKVKDIMYNQRKLARRLMKDKTYINSYLGNEDYETFKFYKKADKIIKISYAVVFIVGMLGVGYSLHKQYNKIVGLNYLVKQLPILNICNNHCKNLNPNDYVVCGGKREKCSDIKNDFYRAVEKIKKIK